MSDVHRLSSTVKDVANPMMSSSMEAVWNNNERKLMNQETKKKDNNISKFVSLPEDIIIDILTRLPVRSLLRLRCVCKSWGRLSKTTSFPKLQLNYSLKNRNNGILIEYDGKIWYLDYDLLWSDASTLYNNLVHIAYPFDYEEKKMLGSCNGIICYLSSKEDILIWNPGTKDYKKIPTPPRRGGDILFNYAFGYDLETVDYKIALFCSSYPYSYLHVYSLNLNSWKTRRFSYLTHYNKLVFFEGLFHWVDDDYKEMCCFDTASETVKYIRLPRHFPHKLKALKVCVLGGCLCLVSCVLKYINIREVWTMKDYGDAESWTKLFTIEKGKLLGVNKLDLKQSFKNDEILVYHDGYYSTYLFDLKHEVCRELKIDNIFLFKAWAFCGNLVSPNLGTCLGRQ